MGMWKVSDSEDPRAGKPVFIVANTDTGLIALQIPEGGGVVFVTPAVAERIRIHIAAAINDAQGAARS